MKPFAVVKCATFADQDFQVLQIGAKTYRLDGNLEELALDINAAVSAELQAAEKEAAKEALKDLKAQIGDWEDEGLCDDLGEFGERLQTYLNEETS